tara:strand:- start:535 stop:729 length:195 start_codon:yes stop_codon:yes gene_type:complete
MPKKKKVVKNVRVKPIVNHDLIQIDIKQELDDEKKIKPEKLFEGYAQPRKKPSPKKKTIQKQKY